MAQVAIEVTDMGGVKLTMTQGPVLSSMIFDPGDAEGFMDALRKAFVEAKQVQRDLGVEPHPHPHPPGPTGPGVGVPERAKRTRKAKG
jgi:hypothetical protein